MARPKNRHCANCIGALSLPMADRCLLMSVYTIAGVLVGVCRADSVLISATVWTPAGTWPWTQPEQLCLSSTHDDPRRTDAASQSHSICTAHHVYTPLAFQQRIRTPHYSPCATQILSCYLLTSFVVIFANSKRCICQAAAAEKRCCWCFACPATPESIAGQHK